MGNQPVISDREKDVQKLCKGVLDMSAKHFDNPNGGYESSCPFCYSEKRAKGAKDIWLAMDEIVHETDCPYLIAKDLSTGLK